MEPEASKFNAFDGFGDEKKVKAKAHIVLVLIELSIAIAAFTLGFYVFAHTQLYDLVTRFLNSVFPDFRMFDALIFAVLFGIALILCALGSESALSKVFYLSWILLLPSVLWFSKLDWFKVLNSPVNFELFATNLSLVEVFLVSLILIGGKIFFFFSSQIKDSRLELLARGASEEDVEEVVFKKIIFFSVLVIFCIIGVFLIGVITPFLKIFPQAWLASLPYPYFIVGLIVTVTLALCVVIYLRSQAEKSQ